MAAKKYFNLSKNLRKFLFERNMKPIDLAREIKVPQPTIHRLVTGKSTRPYKSSLKPIADYFAVTVEQLIGEEALAITTAQPESNTLALHAQKVHAIALVAWKKLSDITAAKATSTQAIAVTQDVSSAAFAVIMPDSSMEPLFPRGAILIFDPVITAVDRSYVLIKSHATQTFSFRQLLLDIDYHYIKSLNPDLTTSKLHLLDKKDKIIACLIESRNNYLPAA